jgi:hypothetical protein
MKQISVAKLNELLMSLKAQRADLLEDKNHMLSTCDFTDPKDDWEYECICNEIADIESAIDNIYNIMCHPDTFVDGDMIYYTEEECF